MHPMEISIVENRLSGKYEKKLVLLDYWKTANSKLKLSIILHPSPHRSVGKESPLLGNAIPMLTAS